MLPKFKISSIHAFIIYSLLSSAILIYSPSLVFFLKTVIKLSTQQVLFLESIYAFSVLIVQVPSGYLADKWNLKKVLVIGSISSCLGFLLLVISKEYIHIVLSYFL